MVWSIGSSLREVYPQPSTRGTLEKLSEVRVFLKTNGLPERDTRAPEESKVIKRKKKRFTRKPYTASDIKLLRQHSKARTPVPKIAKLMKRSEGSLRQKALKLGIGLGHLR
jgi:hypothetical protein